MQRRVCKGMLHLTILTGYLMWYNRSITYKLVLLFFSHSVVSVLQLQCSPPGFSVHGISQAGILEWVAISFSRISSQPRDRTHISCIDRQFFLPLSHQRSPHKKIVYKFMNNKVLPYSIGNYVQYPVTQYNGKECEKECLCIYPYF